MNKKYLEFEFEICKQSHSYDFRQISHKYHVIDINGGSVRVIVSSEGVMHIKLKTNEFGSKVLGLCGNNDNAKDNDFMGRNQAAMSPEEFIEFYACHNADLSELNPNNHVSIYVYM